MLEDFLDRIDVWADSQQPSQDLVLHVMAWLLTRYEDPYQGVRREPGFDNLWQATIPHTHHRGYVVVCSYFIYEGERKLRCNAFATLGWPV